MRISSCLFAVLYRSHPDPQHPTPTNTTGHGSEAETSLEDLTDHGEEWEFSCRCGERCTSAETPPDAWPQGALFQCKGAWMWVGGWV